MSQSGKENQDRENEQPQKKPVLDFEWMTDEYDCDTCGSNYAEGAKVFLDGKCIVSCEPTAYCFDSDDYPEADIYIRTLEALGYEVNFTRLGNE